MHLTVAWYPELHQSSEASFQDLSPIIIKYFDRILSFVEPDNLGFNTLEVLKFWGALYFDENSGYDTKVSI